ncbi:hypothetical protein BD410DRAFT_901182 [Rickenella mellea]|uniref:Uncharacterized protein n=1 Tax=Rickenella mellea TaxID=50990 RepID=A0A4Y7PRN1_9AGAM|nr:hypothetical protein BD410DRAFT_901182 [Rickenella mellea]
MSSTVSEPKPDAGVAPAVATSMPTLPAYSSTTTTPTTSSLTGTTTTTKSRRSSAISTTTRASEMRASNSQHNPQNHHGEKSGAASKLSDALASLHIGGGGGRNRSSIGTAQKPKSSLDSTDFPPQHDPFASTNSDNTSFRIYPTPPASSSHILLSEPNGRSHAHDQTRSGGYSGAQHVGLDDATTTANTAANAMGARRGSTFLGAASDALSFGRTLGASFTRRRSKQIDTPVVNGNANANANGTAHPQQWTTITTTTTTATNGGGGLWKGKNLLTKAKAKDSWALQRPVSSRSRSRSRSGSASALPDVIEISSATSGAAGVSNTSRTRLSTNGSTSALDRDANLIVQPVRRSAEEEAAEQQERERLREAAAQSIGLGPLMREDSFSIGEGAVMEGGYGHGRDAGFAYTFLGDTSRERGVSVSEGDEEEETGDNGGDEEGKEGSNAALHLSSLKSILRPGTPSTIASLSHPHSLRTPTEHSRPPLPSTTGPPPPLPPPAPPQLPQLPAYPAQLAALEQFVQLSCTMQKHSPAQPGLLMFARGKGAWRARHVVLSGLLEPQTNLKTSMTATTVHAPPPAPSASGTSYFPPATTYSDLNASPTKKRPTVSTALSVTSSGHTQLSSLAPLSPSTPATPGTAGHTHAPHHAGAFHLHVFKSSAYAETELERLLIVADSVIFVAESEAGGRRGVVKVGGVEVGGGSAGSGGQSGMSGADGRAMTMWWLQIADAGEMQKWIGAVKNAVLLQRAEKAGLGMPPSSSSSEPRGDLDVMLSMRAQGLITTPTQTTFSEPHLISHAPLPFRPTSPSSITTAVQQRGSMPASPSGIVRSQGLPHTSTSTSDARASLPPLHAPRAVSALKGLFTGSNRPRSPSRASFSQSLSDQPSLDGTIAIADKEEVAAAATPSFTHRGNALLSLLRSGSGMASAAASPPQSPVTAVMPLPGRSSSVALDGSANTVAGGIGAAQVDRPIADRTLLEDEQDIMPASNGDLPQVSNRMEDDVHAIPQTQPLQPAPRPKRPWSSSAISYNSSVNSRPDGASTSRLAIPPAAFVQSKSNLSKASPEAVSVNGSVAGTLNGVDTSPVSSTGVFDTPEQRSRRPSVSSSVSSFASAFADGKSHPIQPGHKTERSNSSSGGTSGSRSRARIAGKLPKMLSPPSGPPPLPPPPPPPPPPTSQVNNRHPSSIGERHPYATPGRASSESQASSVKTSPSVMSDSTSASPPYINGRNRLSMSSAPSVNSSSTTQSQTRKNTQNGLHAGLLFPQTGLGSKRASLPPPQLPAPTFALPPTPRREGSLPRAPDSAPAKRTTFRESLTHRGLKLSLSPPPTTELPPRPVDRPSSLRSHRRTTSGGTTKAASLYTIPASPSAPPPTGPLPPTPQEQYPVLSRHSSIKQRLRMKSAPSPAPSHISFTASLISQNNSPRLEFPNSLPPTPPVPLGEPITTMQNDPNFLNMSPTDSVSHEMNFLHLTSPVQYTPPPIEIPQPPSSFALQPVQGSPHSIELTSLSPPPRRGARRNTTPPEPPQPVEIPEKGKDEESPSSPSVPTTPITDLDDRKTISAQDSAVALALDMTE